MSSKTGKKVLYLADDRFNADWLKTVTENQAVLLLKGGHKVNQIRNAWKQANGFSKPKYDATKKPTVSKTEKKKKEEDK